MIRSAPSQRTAAASLPNWIKPQLTKLVDQPSDGPEWLHEIKYDGYRMHAWLDGGAVRLLTRTGLDWTHKYKAIATAVASLPARQAYLDGELCGVGPDGMTSFSLIQNASDTGNAAALIFFLFDQLHLDGESSARNRSRSGRSVSMRSCRRRTRRCNTANHQTGRGRAFYERACSLKVEGIVSKRADAPYAPGYRGLWLKTKCLNREEFVVVGWTDPEGARPWVGALLLAYHDPDGRLVYAGRVGTGIGHAELERLWRRLQPLATPDMPLAVPPPRDSRFGSPLVRAPDPARGSSRWHIFPQIIINIVASGGASGNAEMYHSASRSPAFARPQYLR
jgi:bifunctional non-homologous end joining protein LigD